MEGIEQALQQAVQQLAAMQVQQTRTEEHVNIISPDTAIHEQNGYENYLTTSTTS